MTRPTTTTDAIERKLMGSYESFDAWLDERPDWIATHPAFDRLASLYEQDRGEFLALLGVEQAS